MPDTQMSAAFAAAGYRPPPESDAERLDKLMAQAILEGKSLSAPSTAVFLRLLRERETMPITWALFAGYHEEAVRRLFNRILMQVRAGKKFNFDEGRQGFAETHSEGAASSESDATAETIRAVQPTPILSRAVVVAPSASLPTVPHRPPTNIINGMQMVLHWQKDCWLKRVTINNKSVANLTLAELEDAIKQRAANTRFLKLVRSAIPAYANGGRVGDYVTDADGDKLYEQAREADDE